MINQILNQLGASTKITVGVSVSPGIGLEMIEVDRNTKTIVKYGCKSLEYDYSKREIADYDIFRETMIDLFDELKISRKSNVVLNLPSVHMGIMNVAMMLGDEGVKNVLISEIEQSSYIFKRQDAVVSWMDAYNAGSKADTREVVYAAIQQSALDEINAACLEIGCSILAIENSFVSLLKTLHYTELAAEQMQANTPWNLMVINQNSYSIITLNGTSIVEFREEPLALRSFVSDEIYNAIVFSSQLSLQTIPANFLYIVSETDLVSAEVLSMKLPFEGQVSFLESNKYVQTGVLEASYNILPNMVLKITPEAIGAGIYQITNFPYKLNLLGQKAVAGSIGIEEAPKITIGNVEVELNSAFLKKTSILISLIIALPAILLIIGLNKINDIQTQKLNGINDAISKSKTEMESYADIDKKNEFDIKLETDAVHSQNRTKLLYYSAIGLNLPPKTWLTYLSLNNNGRIDIIGRSTNVENIYNFYKGLKLSVINSDLRLHKLEMASDSLDSLIDNSNSQPTFYEFEITNISEGELMDPSAVEPPTEDGKKDENAKSPAEARNKRGLFPADFFSTKKEQSSPGEQENRQNQPAPPSHLPANLESIEKF